MADQSNQEILGSEERQALRHQELLYGDRILDAASALSQILELSSEASKELLDRLDDVIERGARYEERHDVALHLEAVASILGSHAIAKVIEMPEKPSPKREENVQLDDDHIKWLREHYGEAQAEKLSIMNSDQRDIFIRSIDDIYLAIKIRGVPIETKKAQVKIFEQFLQNKAFKEIARESKTPTGRIIKAQTVMATRIAPIVALESVSE